jgi:hypothetical protein
MRAAVILSWALLLIVQCALADAKPGRVIVDLHAPSAEIRQMLLKHTPVGSSVDSVARFISTQLAVPGSGSPETVPAVADPSRPRAAKANPCLPGTLLQTSRVNFFDRANGSPRKSKRAVVV